MTDHLHQRLVETFQAVESHHAGKRAEMQAEIDRLRTNIVALGDYTKAQAAEYGRKADAGGIMAEYHRGRADAYFEMGMRADIAYMKEAAGDEGKQVSGNV